MPPVPPEMMRVSSTERQRTAEWVAQAWRQGILSLAEFDARTAAAYAATTRGDLTALTTDLPTPRPDALPATPHREPRAIGVTVFLHELAALAAMLATVLLVVCGLALLA